jgi:enamine deaminase RidA (YjgF/YER057c/UK114 family)
MAHEILKLKSVHETKDRGYSHVAKAGKTLYIAGQVAKDVQGNLMGKGDFDAQARQVYTNLQNFKGSRGRPEKHC